MLNKLFNRDTPERTDGLVPVAKVSELEPGKLKKVIVKGQAIVLTMIQQDNHKSDVGAYDIVAFTAMCPHALGDLSQGWVDKDEVNCPTHYYQYSLRTGECTYPKGGPKIQLYPVTVEGNLVLLKVEKPKWMDATQP